MSIGKKRFSNVVIRASAGTGKTFQLSNRFLALLCDSRPQDAILASTFTRKAAGEILSRLISRLALAALDDHKASELGGFIGADSLDRRGCLKMLKNMVRQLHRLRVGTLDQFFMQIARSFSLELALPPAWRVVDEVVDDNLRALAIRDLLASESTADAVRLVHLLTKGEASRSISQQVADLVGELYRWYLESPPSAWQPLKKRKMPPAEKIEARLAELEEAELPSGKRFADGRDGDIKRFRAERWEEFIAKGLAAKVADGSLRYYNKAIPASLANLYQPLLAHAKAALINMIANQTQATFELLDRFDRSYRLLKQAQRAMRFEDVTRAIGGEWTEEHLDAVLYRLDAPLLHLLLDEFQDTSLMQWQVLRPFARRVVGRGQERSFFCVGDVKQAIYGWRGGVAEIFDALEGELAPAASEGLQHESLQTSYRSSPAVIDTVNQVFGSIAANPALDAYRLAAVAWGERFTTHDTTRSELTGYCRLATSPRAGQNQSQADVTLGYAADEISRMKQLAPQADIGVLVRKNKTVGRMIYELRRRGLEASEEGGNPLCDSPAVQLILSLLRLADHPGDTTARFHVARSPLGLAVGFMRHDDSLSAVRLSADVRRRLMADGYGPTVDACVRELSALCDRRDLGRLARLVELAYEYDSEATSRPGDFVQIVERRRVEDPSSARLRVMTVHQAKGLQFDVVVLPELDAKLRGQPGMVAVGRAAATEPIRCVCRYVSQTTRAILPDKLVQMFEQQEQRDVEEALCILYVSMTRAVHALHMIVAPSARNERNLPATFAGVLRGSLCEETKSLEPETVAFEHGQQQWFAATAKAASTVEPRTAGEAAILASKTAQMPQAKPLQIKLAPSSKASRRDLQRRSPSQLEGGPLVDLASRLRLDNAAALRHGTLIHAWFEQIAWLDDGKPEDDALLRIARRQGLSPQTAAQELDQFHRILAQPDVRDALSLRSYQYLPSNSQACSSPKTGQRSSGPRASAVHITAAEPVAAPRWRLWRERKFAVADGDAILSGSIDRMVVLYDGHRPLGADLIDFKTDAVSLDSSQVLAERVEHYRPQLEAYRHAVCQLTGLPAEKISARLLFTHAGCLKTI